MSFPLLETSTGVSNLIAMQKAICRETYVKSGANIRWVSKKNAKHWATSVLGYCYYGSSHHNGVEKVRHYGSDWRFIDIHAPQMMHPDDFCDPIIFCQVTSWV